MPSIVPFVGRALRRLGVDANYRRSAVKRWLVEPACDTVNLPALYDEGDLAKVTAVPAHTSLAFQMERLNRRTTAHPPRYAYLVRDVTLAEGHLFRWRLVQPLADRPLPAVSRSPSEQVPKGVLAATEYGNRFFGHWFCDDVPLAMSATEHGEFGAPIVTDAVPSAHQREYAALLQPTVRPLRHAFIRELLVFEGAPETTHQRLRYEQMRRRLGTAKNTEHPGVMILRKASGQQRLLKNEGAIADGLAKRGFQVLDPMQCNLRQILAACAGARMVVGTEGSHLTHGFLPLAAGGTFVTLQPPFKFDHFWKERCDCIGARYAFVVGDPKDDGFVVDESAVYRMIDRVERRERAAAWV